MLEGASSKQTTAPVLGESVSKIEIDLINACTLKCPICVRQTALGKSMKPGVHLEIQKLRETLGEFKNLEIVELVGSVSEPTLHPDFTELVKALKNQNLKLRLSTNGDSRSPKFWESIGDLFDLDDIVRFAIDGSTQELHSKYRVGGSLERVLDNYRCFRENSEAVTVLQNILFEYNLSDREEMKELFLKNDFDYLEFTDSGEPEDIQTIETETDVIPRKELRDRYREHRCGGRKTLKVNCQCLLEKKLYITHLGFILPCDDLENTFFLEYTKGIKIPNIYENSLKECLEFVNSLVKKRYLNPVCMGACSERALAIKEDFPVLQCGKDLVFKTLQDYRGVIQ